MPCSKRRLAAVCPHQRSAYTLAVQACQSQKTAVLCGQTGINAITPAHCRYMHSARFCDKPVMDHKPCNQHQGSQTNWTKIQDGWDRRGHPPAVLVEGDWALLTCTPGRAGPSGGRDRLQLIKLKSATETQKQQAWPLC